MPLDLIECWLSHCQETCLSVELIKALDTLLDGGWPNLWREIEVAAILNGDSKPLGYVSSIGNGAGETDHPDGSWPGLARKHNILELTLHEPAPGGDDLIGRSQ